MSGLGKTASFYRDNPASYRKKLAKANTHPVWGEQTAKRKKKRSESAKKRTEENNRRKKSGRTLLSSKEHYDHKGDNFKSEKANTGQSEKSRVKGSRRNKRNFGKSIRNIIK